REDLEQGGFAAAALDTLDGLRAAHGRLDRPVPVGEAGGTLVVDTAPGGADEGGDPGLRCARRLRDSGAEVIVVSRDAGRRVLAAGLGLSAQDYHAQEVVDTGWTGMATVAADEAEVRALAAGQETTVDRKSTRLNSSHVSTSYAVFCLKQKNNKRPHDPP